ncbi:hypothetical protein ACO2J1_15895 [Leptospira interrogans]|nr:MULTISPECIES: hypothetical protein [Leptospira]EMN72864.1 hypothetical protein LEP1GSC100_0368 [Leptospira interrogans serovar Bataviae str. UI 08561]AJR16191.1 hypothetical protein LIL_13589 [Leptospira interrogans serovar Linhai str. 56609]EJO76402.1 hypothetical protein LEP1GSC045_2335 [Leptospira interrogans serovar Pomona str. Kennewicki LC82-25]EKN97722.1 hypothetical protein LEP1GSC014_3443 [Leptospira interrogans serovar Pomona str. Pomona]EKO69163.1 hypothetical protein LEP1GSC069_
MDLKFRFSNDKIKKKNLFSKTLLLGFILFLIFFFITCAHMNYIARFEKKGQVVDTAAMTDAANELKLADITNINAYVIEFPPGISLNGNTLLYDEKKWELLGTVHSDYNQGNHWFWFYDYVEEESWKKPYCYWQVPLNWVTLGIWGITPFYYPCIIKESKDDVQAENNRKIRIVNSLKKITKIAGGDTVLVESFGDLRINFFNANTGQNVGTIGIKTVSGSGWVLKKKKDKKDKS